MTMVLCVSDVGESIDGRWWGEVGMQYAVVERFGEEYSGCFE